MVALESLVAEAEDRKNYEQDQGGGNSREEESLGADVSANIWRAKQPKGLELTHVGTSILDINHYKKLQTVLEPPDRRHKFSSLLSNPYGNSKGLL